MGNCQAIDAATVVIQHPSGKEEKLYWSVTAADIMKANPGHYVALLITSALCPSGDRLTSPNSGGGLVRVTRVKILRPTDVLTLGRVYRLITAHEVMKGLREKKQAKIMTAKKENQPTESESVRRGGEADTTDQVTNDRTNRPTTTAAVRSRSWQPSLKSISEAGN